MEAFTKITSRAVVLNIDDIDTDQIIPARFLTTTTRQGLGQGLFADWRFDEHHNKRGDCALNSIDPQTTRILVAGHNFGCGSSREHAAWALHDFGFRAVISTKIADIFRNNALKNGIVPVVVEPAVFARLIEPFTMPLTIDIEQCRLYFGESQVSFELDSFARTCLMQGVDQLGYLLQQQDAINAFETHRNWQS